MAAADGVGISGASGGYELQAELISTPVERELKLEFGSILLYITASEGILGLQVQSSDARGSEVQELRPNRGPFSSEAEALTELVARLVHGLDPNEV
jgi:hypothetical protein